MDDFFIVGAGPTGLAASLFLAKHGIKSEIVDKNTTISPYSKALGVNPRTLTLLESTGVTDQMLAEGWKAHRMNFWRNGKVIAHVDMSKAKTKYPFMLVLPQSKSEALLEAALNKEGIQVNRGLEITEQNIAEYKSRTILGADGAHSFMRHHEDIPMLGDAYEEPWQVVDVNLEVPLEKNEGHVFLLPDGGLFMLRVEGNMWRLATNQSNPLELLPKGTEIGDVVWQSEFHIAHRIAQRLQKDNVYLAGDAAHLHSPLGARGMNLGIEDAFVFAKLAKLEQLAMYHNQRYPIDKGVVDGVRRLTQIPRGKLPWVKLMRLMMPFVAPVFAPIMRKWVMGLDHEV